MEVRTPNFCNKMKQIYQYWHMLIDFIKNNYNYQKIGPQKHEKVT